MHYRHTLSLILGAALALAQTCALSQTTAVKFQLGWLKNVESAPVFAAQEAGYFKERGLEVGTMTGGPQIDPIAILASGAVDVAIVSSALPVIAARSRGLPIVVLGSMFKKSPLGLAARADKPIELPRELAGKRVGYQPVNRTWLQAILKRNGLKDSDITTSTVTADPTALMDGRIDLMTVSVLNVPLTMKERGVPARTWLAYDLGVPLEGNIIVCLEETLAKRRPMVEALIQALAAGLAYNIQNPDEVSRFVVAKYSEGLSINQQLEYNRGQIPLYTSKLTAEKGLLWMDASTWDRSIEVAVETGLINTPIERARLLNFGVLEKSGARKL